MKRGGAQSSDTGLHRFTASAELCRVGLPEFAPANAPAVWKCWVTNRIIRRENHGSWGWDWWPDPLPEQGQLEQGAWPARRTPLSSALPAHEVTCIAGCHQKAIKFQAWDGVKYDLFCCLCALFILSQPFLRAQLGAAVLRMRNRSKLWLLS